MRNIELLAPAKNKECGMAAIDHGADAVYIGAEHFGARSAAGNTVDDIRSLCEYAHIFKAKVYVTINTLIFDNELEDSIRLINRLYEAGVDAILVQDMGLLNSDLPPISLHASTQTDNRSAAKVAWLRDKGFSRVVLARELSAHEISDIHKSEPTVELEVFVHGALCVSYSGICYASQYCFKRSANRGECAQFCRLKFNLEDSDGNILIHDKHLLSLKDMCRYDRLETLLQAGVTSFKIEGRLKDISYVKNVTAAYSERLNEIIARNPDLYCRASLGRCRYTFVPNLNKTFNRGFTDYFIDGKRSDISSFDTPKSRGEFVGRVKEIRGKSFNVSTTAAFANGDGLCFINDRQELEGFRVNKAEGNRILPLKIPAGLRPGKALYRNNDQVFEKLLSRPSSVRKIPISMKLSETQDGFTLKATIKDAAEVSINIKQEKQIAQKPQHENIVRQLTKLGNTPFECNDVEGSNTCFNYFIPSSLLADMRRKITEKLICKLQKGNIKNIRDNIRYDESKVLNAGNKAVENKKGSNDYPKRYQYLYNVSNRMARKFYDSNGLSGLSDAFELKQPAEALLMQCKHCIKYALGHCVKRGGSRPDWHEPMYLRLADGRRFRLEFNCSACQMNIYSDK